MARRSRLLSGSDQGGPLHSLVADLLDDAPKGVRLQVDGAERFQSGDFEGALRLFRRALAELRRLGDRRGECATLAGVTSCLLTLGRFPQALKACRQCQVLARTLSDAETEQTALHQEGEIHLLAGKPEQALQAYASALELARRRKDREEQADEHTSMAACLRHLNRHEEALEHLKQAVPLYEREGRQEKLRLAMAGLAVSLKALGRHEEAAPLVAGLVPADGELETDRREASLLARASALHESGDHARALALTRELLSLLRDQRAVEREASVLHLQGNILQELERYEEAARANEKALALRRRHGLPGQSASLHNLGLDYEALDHLDEASRCLLEALELFREERNEEGEASAREILLDIARQVSNEGARHYRARHLEDSAASFEKACDIVRRVGGAERRLSHSLKGLGDAYKALGRLGEALQAYRETLEIHRRLGDEVAQGEALDFIASVLGDMGSPQEALACYEQALDLQRRAADDKGEDTTLNNIALIYLFLGEHDRALRSFLRRLEVVRRLGDLRAEGTTLNNIGGAYEQLGDLAHAQRYFEQALEVQRRAEDREGQLFALLNLAGMRLRAAMDPDHPGELEEVEAALGVGLQAVRIALDLDSPFHLATAYHELGGFLTMVGYPERARPYLEEALELWRRLGNREQEAWTLSALAMAGIAGEDSGEASALLEQALDLLEEQRTTFLTPEYRAGFFTRAQDLYAFLLARRVREGDVEGAFRLAERARARSFLDLMDEARSGLRAGCDPQLLEQERRLLQERARLSAVRAGLIDVDPAARPGLDEQEIELERAFQANQAEIRRRSPRYASLTRPEPWSLETVQRQLLDARTILLEYVLGDRCSHLFAVLPDRCEVFELPAREEIERQVEELLHAVKAGGPCPHAHALYHSLVAPARELLGERALLVVADGILHYLPFALLLTADVDPAPVSAGELPYLIRERSILFAPSATVAGLVKRERPSPETVWPLELLAFADPRSFAGAPSLPSTGARQRVPFGRAVEELPASRGEVARIAELMQGGAARQAELAEVEAGVRDAYRSDRIEMLLGSRMIREALQARFSPGGEGCRVRFVHFATHGLVDETAPLFSGLVLSSATAGGDLWHAFEIFDARISAELVVLSACDSGLGRPMGGEGLVGLIRAFFYAGAGSVCASLWSVEDQPTADLMVAFYRHLLEDREASGSPVSKAEALRRAQLDLIATPAAAPCCWAGFVLIGAPGETSP